MSVVVLRGDARALPLPDASVDLIVTSVPYWGLRNYTDGGEPMPGQIGSEATPEEWLANLLDCIREWCRVLKPQGSMFVNCGDKYDSGTTTGRINPGTVKDGQGQGWHQATPRVSLGRPKSLLGLPWRLALACTDQLGLILRRDIIWAKPNGLPESVTDRCRSSHEYLFHLVRQPRYYAAVDEIREEHSGGSHMARKDKGPSPWSLAILATGDHGLRNSNTDPSMFNPLGKLPGSVWTIPSQPLTVPDWVGVDHFAAFPCELPRRCILGWSPPGICTACGEGRRPVGDRELTANRRGRQTQRGISAINGGTTGQTLGWERSYTITGYACACAPYTDHDGSGRATQRRDYSPGLRDNNAQGTYGRHQAGEYERVGAWREYHLDGWRPLPTRPALVVDPFGGTGTTALVASVLGRTGVSIDRSADYCRLARWRCTDPAERARAMQVPKPPPVPSGQVSLFDLDAAGG